MRRIAWIALLFRRARGCRGSLHTAARFDNITDSPCRSPAIRTIGIFPTTTRELQAGRCRSRCRRCISRRFAVDVTDNVNRDTEPSTQSSSRAEVECRLLSAEALANRFEKKQAARGFIIDQIILRSNKSLSEHFQ